MYSLRMLWIQILVILNAILLLQSMKSWTDKQLYPSHKIPEDALSTRRSVVRRKIVLYHNFFRTKVRPTASNMLLMSWHPLAARQAQNYAERCVFLRHNDPQENTVPLLGACGQNLFVASQKTPWYNFPFDQDRRIFLKTILRLARSNACVHCYTLSAARICPVYQPFNGRHFVRSCTFSTLKFRFFALKTWFLEYQNFTYGAPVRNLKAVGHYTQMVWATSHKVGCGVAHCPGGPWGHFYNYVCHYCPGGNFDTITQYPYKPGPKCGDCPESCISDSLCSNSCSQRDFYSNCDSLLKITDICHQGTCNATCICGNKRIHKNYPWL